MPAKRGKKALEGGPWMPGVCALAREGPYLRYFDDIEDCAYSEFRGGAWTRDGFWRSDVQDAPWRGVVEVAGGSAQRA